VLNGEATAEQAQGLDRLLRERPELVPAVVDLIGQEACLAWSSLDEAATSFDRSGVAPQATVAGKPASLRNSFTPPVLSHWASLAIAAMLLLSAGVAIGMLSVGSRGEVASNSGRIVGPDVALKPLSYSARIVETSTCRWTPGADYTANGAGELRQGDSVHLLEGLAKLRLQTVAATADLGIEGPAGLVLTADGGCNISHGLVTTAVRSIQDSFVLHTPSCEVNLDRVGSLGISVDGRDVEVHVLDGEARIVVPWGVGNLDSQSYQLQAGESLALLRGANGKFGITRGMSRPKQFASLISMESDHLRISRDYVDDVLARKPLIYWRFDEMDSIRVANSAGKRYAGNIIGKLDREDAPGNPCVSFAGGISSEELNGCILADELIDFGDAVGYSIEMWIKPSHYHHGSIAAMFSDGPGVVPHALLLEVGGPNAAQFSIEEPGKIRFLHRSPPTNHVNDGHSCFSPKSYRSRQWQHVVAVKDASEIRLYIDGIQVASEKDASPVVSGMKLLLGRIDDKRRMRRFIGQIDEFVLYDSALSEEVVRHHFDLVKEQPLQQSNDTVSSTGI